MDAHDFLDGFRFQNDSIINQAVDPIAAVNIQALVGHWHWILKTEGQICQAKLIGQTLLISRFQ